jgi:Zn-dependent protease
MKTTLYDFQFRDIRVSIHWTFILIIIWFVIANLLTGFNENGWIWSFIMIFSLLASIFAHDLAQALVGTICRIEIDGLIIMPIGSLPSLVKKPQRKIYELLMIGAGPAVNLTIAALLLFFLHPYKAYWNEGDNIGAAYSGNFIFQLQFINLSLGLLNLLPAFPMDGGRALETLLEKKYASPKAVKIVNITSIWIALGFFAAAIIYMQYPLILIGIFILLTLRIGKYYHPLKNGTAQTSG